MSERGVTFLIHSQAGRSSLLRDVLYAVVGQVHPEVTALVMMSDGDGNHASLDLVSRMDGLGGVQVRALTGPGEMAAAFNAGLVMVETEYCAFLGDLDLVYPRHAALLAGCLERAPGAHAARGVAYAAAGRLAPDGFITHRKQRLPIATAAEVPSPVASAAFLLRTAELRRAGTAFDTATGVDCRLALLGRVVANRRVSVVEQPVAEVRSIEALAKPVGRAD
jgi:hypothetical protein